ncbi:MAG: phage tail tube protein [Pseudomonadota bacterium]
MPRYIRNTVILAKIETAYGVDSTPTGAANAMLVSNVSINPLNASNISRDLIRGYLGGSEQIPGVAYIETSFDVEFQNGGTAGTAAAWGQLLRACGFAEVLLTTPSRVEYTPISASFESATIYYHDDGVLHKLLGCRGDVTIKASVGERPVFSFKFLGLDGGISATANATPTLTGFKTPLIVTDGNTGDITLGCTYSAGALSGGTVYASRGIEIAMGNKVAHTPLLGGETIDLTDRDATGKVELDLTAANEVSFMATVKAATTQGLGIVHGTTAGYKMLMHAPAAQLINPKKSDVNGRRLIGYDVRLTPSSGNDELRIVAL